MITVNISQYDLNQLKSMNFTTDVMDTYLAIDASTTFDLASVPNRLMPITTDASLMANDFISDSSPPQLSSFDLDFNSDLLRFSI